MSSKDFVLEESTYDQNIECESQVAHDCIKVIKPGEPAWFNNEEDTMMCQPCMGFLIKFEQNEARRKKKLPLRRYRVHFQEKGQAKSMSSFELYAHAQAEEFRVHQRGGTAMIEDRWNGVQP